MKRGDFVTIAAQGDFGKLRPALVIQTDRVGDDFPSVTVLPVTSTVVPGQLIRVTVAPSAENGLQKLSQVMVDKTMTVKREKIGAKLGAIDADGMKAVERNLAVFLGIA